MLRLDLHEQNDKISEVSSYTKKKLIQILVL